MSQVIERIPEYHQTTDPRVSKQKFMEEVAFFKTGEVYQRRRGILLIAAEFPDVLIAFSAVTLSPPPIVFGVRINFTNYDAAPLSVKFVNIFTGQQVPLAQMQTRLCRKMVNQAGVPLPPQELLQAETPQDFPFFCIPGTREYHEHPFHTGDSWWLHRQKDGEGTLGFIVEKLYEYGLQAIQPYQLVLNFNGLPITYDPNRLPL